MAQRSTRSIGIQNLFQLGLVKKMIIANHLGNKLITTKRMTGTGDFNNPEIHSAVVKLLST